MTHIESKSDYYDWVEEIAETWVSDWDREEQVVSVAQQCLTTYRVVDGEPTLTTVAEPWHDYRGDPCDVIRYSNDRYVADDGNGEPDVRFIAAKTLAGDIVEAADRIEELRGVGPGDVVAVDEYMETVGSGTKIRSPDTPVFGRVIERQEEAIWLKNREKFSSEVSNVVEILDRPDEEAAGREQLFEDVEEARDGEFNPISSALDRGQ